MNIYAFVVIVTLLFLCPYIPAVLVGKKVGLFKNSYLADGQLKFVSYWIAEALIALAVFVSAFLLSNCPLNTNHSGSLQYLEQTWDIARFSAGGLGFLLGCALIYRAGQIRQSNRDTSIFLISFGVLCTLYGPTLPGLMASVLAAARDCQLMR